MAEPYWPENRSELAVNDSIHAPVRTNRDRQAVLFEQATAALGS